MIGVLSCLCRGVSPYAGLAGTAYKNGSFLLSANAFRAAAEGLGLTPVVDAPTSPPLSGFHPPSAENSGFGPITQAQHQAALDRLVPLRTRNLGGNVPLTCAAPKMIQKCLADGHKPGTMIEMWVSFKEGGSSVTIPEVHTIVADPSSPVGTITVRREHKSEGWRGRPFMHNLPGYCHGNALQYRSGPPCP